MAALILVNLFSGINVAIKNKAPRRRLKINTRTECFPLISISLLSCTLRCSSFPYVKMIRIPVVQYWVAYSGGQVGV